MANETLAEAGAVTPLAISTAQWQEQDRFDAWREQFGQCIARVDVQTLDRAGFSSDLLALSLPHLTLSRTGFTPCSLMRTPSLLRDGDDSLVFIIGLEGEGIVGFGDDQVRVRPGSGTLAVTDRIGGFSSDMSGTTCSIRIDRAMACQFAPSVERALLREARPNDPAIHLLRTYVEAVLSTGQGLSPAAAALVDSQIRELLALIVNPAGDLARSGAYGGIKAARLRAVQQDIATHLADPSLNAQAVGRRLAVSARYVQSLMEGVGFTFSTYVREERLGYARRLLRDPLLAPKRIIEICEMAGFSDLSHFNRAFRARFGHTPKEARAGR